MDLFNFGMHSRGLFLNLDWHNSEAFVLPLQERHDLYLPRFKWWPMFRRNRLLSVLSPPILENYYQAILGNKIGASGSFTYGKYVILHLAVMCLFFIACDGAVGYQRANYHIHLPSCDVLVSLPEHLASSPNCRVTTVVRGMDS